MLLRQMISQRIGDISEGGPAAALPPWLKLDRVPMRNWMARRLGGYRVSPIGAVRTRSTTSRIELVSRAAVGQRVVVRCSRVGLRLDGAGRASSLARHLSYIGRESARAEGVDAAFFDQHGPTESPRSMVRTWSVDRHYFRVIISPDNGDRIADLEDFVRDLMGRVGADLGAEDLTWIGACHLNTAHPHAHVVVRGRRPNGQDLDMPRAYLMAGLRDRAEETARDRLGAYSRTAPERTVWRTTRADAFTSIDRRVIASASRDGLVNDAAGGRDAWAALTRTRLAHLEALGLARREGRRFRLAPDLAARLDGLWVRLGDTRAMNQRRVLASVATRPLGHGRFEGRATFTGALDRGGARRFVFVRDQSDVERYARLNADTPPIALGQGLTLHGGSARAHALSAAALDETLSL